MTSNTVARSLTVTALAFALAACGGAPDAAESSSGESARSAATGSGQIPAAVGSSSLSEARLVDELVANLQACSYDGAPVRLTGVSSALPDECRDMVAQIMKFTGLPQNFKVVEARVPNAAAIIMLDEQKIPQRVIAFNRDFMNIVRAATDGNAWAPVSVMAHEIGHHLSGHTITPGGSQPPTELEADKFSGFVLYKMGASLDDAQAAMVELVADGPDGPTHPGRSRRLGAIHEGWTQACKQQGGASCDRGGGKVAQSSGLSASPAPAVAEPVPAAPSPTTGATVAAPVATASSDRLPAPGSTPAKFDRFIYDEYGYVDASWRARFEKAMFEHAQQFGVEIVTLLVKDLHGLSGDDYALAMLRQLRVGKLDVGNGAVLVVAPEQSQVGIAMGPGVAFQMRSHDKKAQLQRWLDAAWSQCRRKRACGNWSENLMLAADHIRRDTNDIEWSVRYASLGELMGAYNAYNDARSESGAGFDPATDPSYRKIALIDADVVANDLPSDYAGVHVDPISSERARAVHGRTEGYEKLALYLAPGTENLMPGGSLEAGRRYRFVVRVKSVSWNPKDTQSFDVLSYDALH